MTSLYIRHRLARLGWWLAALPLFLLHLVAGVLLLPVGRLRLGRMTARGIGHLALNTELFFRRRYLARASGAAGREFIVLVSGDPANEQLFAMWARTARVWRLPRVVTVMDATINLWRTSPFFDPLDMWSNEYAEFQAAPPTLQFTADEIRRGRAGLADLGINPDRDWFVCMFARDANYVSSVYGAHDWSYHDFRDADIRTFTPAADVVVARGGVVVRMGSHARTPMPGTSARVIDYPLSPFRSDFMDIFLAAHCRCFVGSMSGIDAIATIFDRPRLAVNTVPFAHAPWGKDSLFIPKLLVAADTGVPFTFGHLLRAFADRFDPKLWNGLRTAEQGYRYVNNTPEEIRAATTEMLDRLDGVSQPDADAAALQRAYFDLVPAHHWSAGVKTPVGADFLRVHRTLLSD